jgi:hypothetical protein
MFTDKKELHEIKSTLLTGIFDRKCPLRLSLQTALEERQRQLAAADGRGEADENHRPMAAALARLIRRIKEAVAGPRAAPAAAGIEGSVEGMSIEGMSTVN